MGLGKPFKETPAKLAHRATSHSRFCKLCNTGGGTTSLTPKVGCRDGVIRTLSLRFGDEWFAD